MRKLICKECGQKYFTADTITPLFEMEPCENCGGKLEEITDEVIYEDIKN